MDSDSAEMANEIRSKVILHWNCRGFVEFPEAIRTYGRHIQEIYLKWNKLTTLPPWIVELFNVTNLYVYGNMIKELPTEVGRMTQLTVLDLSANHLEEIPPCIGSLANLKSLLLNNNAIEKLPAEMEQLCNLEFLSISGNKIVALPEWVGSLSRLKELNADNNRLKELPNRLTLSQELSILSVCSNRLRYLPLNAFVSSPCIRFDANKYLNYLSYTLLYQLTAQIHNVLVQDRRSSIGYGCFKMHSDSSALNANIKLNVKVDASNDKITDLIIELPRQLLKVYNVHENTTVSMWELALRKIYVERYKHTVNISTSPVNIRVQYESIAKKESINFSMYPINYASCNLLINGPIGICVNSHCEQPIFTEAWVITGISRPAEAITTIALCCSKRCASKFLIECNMRTNLDWQLVN